MKDLFKEKIKPIDIASSLVNQGKITLTEYISLLDLITDDEVLAEMKRILRGKTTKEDGHLNLPERIHLKSGFWRYPKMLQHLCESYNFKIPLIDPPGYLRETMEPSPFKIQITL